MRLVALSVALAGGVVLAACGGDDGASSAAPPAGCREAADGAITVVAKDLAWDTDCLSLPADTEITITVDNQDDGVNHNIHLLGLPGGQPKTELEAGPIEQTLPVTVPAGEFVFVCDIHPNMKGDLRVG